ncbi:HD domain-containing protein [Paenibacillus alginolyticus]|uniref:HD domain-containing phosphohydrolase n=1 Tax=Paenibacillus alginolyticus TaxID=59839 RepID=UPI0004093413|nr:HD domain-containing phosphohydrolase [Paenibacillus alginolyticus]MCY9664239.1 HD domain-containing protein [Paenibacillus alginolyticus]
MGITINSIWQMSMQRIAPYETEMFIVLVGLFLLAALCFRIANQFRKQEKSRLEHALLLLERLQPSAGLENNLSAVLELIGTIVIAPGYAFYILDTKNHQFSLKAVRNSNKYPGTMAPSYSGLLPHNKEIYLPVLSLPAQAAPTQLTLGKEGELPLFSMPVGQYGLIRIGPLSRISKKAIGQLKFVASILPKLLDLLIEAEQMKMKTEVIVTSGDALHAVGAMALDSEAAISKMVSMFSVALGVNAAFVLTNENDGTSPVIAQGWAEEAEIQLADAAVWVRPLFNREELKEDTIVVSPRDLLYERIPQIFKSQQGDTFVFCRFRMGINHGVLVCRMERNTSGDWNESEKISALSAAAQSMSKLVGAQGQMKLLAAAYSELLKLLSRTIDNLNPYTVGYSEQMALYSAAIAQELKLPRKEIAAISLAAYLSNIGVLGLPEDLYLKEGKFSETEFEKMKLHAQVGATIVEMTIGDKVVADSIRYHHERMDGNGYPSGLKGCDIPVGARIIAVVQTFLAKIGGRKYREPLPFDKALNMLRSSEGSQLDAMVVQAFIQWFERKRTSPEIASNKPLGPCWEMCSAPSYMCQSCPAYEQESKPCWEFESNNCQSHGKSCQSCFVYTETQGRSSRITVAGKL